MTTTTDTIRQSRLRQLLELFEFFELDNDERALRIVQHCGTATLREAKNSDLKNLLDELNEEKKALFQELKASAIQAGLFQRDNHQLMDAWKINQELSEHYGVTLHDARASHLKKIIHLLETGEKL